MLLHPDWRRRLGLLGLIAPWGVALWSAGGATMLWAHAGAIDARYVLVTPRYIALRDMYADPNVVGELPTRVHDTPRYGPVLSGLIMASALGAGIGVMGAMIAWTLGYRVRLQRDGDHPYAQRDDGREPVCADPPAPRA